MAEFAAFPLWLDSYLLDTTELKTVEHGAYLLILFAMWRAGGYLPNNDEKLARCARMPLSKWMQIKPTMMEFLSVDGDQITQGRLLDELTKARTRSAKAAQSARAKYRKTNKPMSANAEAKDSSQSASISVSLSEESSLRSDSAKRRLRVGEKELLVTLDNEHARAVVDHRLKLKKPLTEHAAGLLAQQFAKCPDPNAAADAMVVNGWQGFKPEWLERQSGRAPQRERKLTEGDIAREYLRRYEQNGDTAAPDADDREAFRQLPAPNVRGRG